MRVRRRNALRALYHAVLDLLPDEWAIQILYYRRFGRFANLRAPRTLNEKTNWRKLHQRDPRFTLYSDKEGVKEEIARLVGREHVVATLWAGERPEDIPFRDLRPPFVIKTTHASGNNIFIRRPEDIDEEKIIAAMNRELRRSHGKAARQWGYYGIPRKVLVERMLDIFGNGIPEDHKFFVYHGRVHFIQIDVDTMGTPKRAFYDRHWNKLPMTEDWPDIERPIPRPAYLEEMIGIAEQIGAAFDFVRIDLYYETNTVLFGEATFYDSAGFSKPSPDIWDEKFGEPWNLTIPKT